MVSQNEEYHDSIKKVDDTSYEYIRTAKRNRIAAGSLVYVYCSSCDNMVPLLSGRACGCGNITIEVTADGKCSCTGGKGPIDLYRAFVDEKSSSDDMIKTAEAVWRKNLSDSLSSKKKPRKPTSSRQVDKPNMGFSWK